MTHIYGGSRHYTVQVTDHTNEMAERLGYNIAGEEFISDIDSAGNEIRGYLKVTIFGMVQKQVGPVTMRRDDVIEWRRQ